MKAHRSLSFRALVASAALAALVAPTPALARTLRTITVDGNLDDWADVLLDRDQKVADRSTVQGDPDAPGQAQRDERGVAFTWDATYLYLYFSRTGSGTNSFNSIFYFDLGHDGLLSAADEIAFFKMSGSSFNSFEIDRYSDGGTPDPVTGDGVSEAGTNGAFLSNAGGTAAGDVSGIHFEARIAWTTLGVPSGAPLFIHASMSANTNLPAGIEDNTDRLDTRLVDVRITAGTTKGTAPGRFRDFPHRVTNDGTATDTIELSTRTRLGFSVALWSDPNGDGNPVDGVLLSRDANGDGDTTDPGDVAPGPSADTDGDGQVDGGPLAAGASRAFVARVTAPARAALGSEDAIRIFASSAYRPAHREDAEDRLRVGFVSLTPPRDPLSSPGRTAWLAHAACNDSGTGRVLDATFASAQGWSGTFYSDPNGDGDPSDGAPLSDTDGDGLPDLGLVADGVCVPLVFAEAVPAGAVAGVSDAVTVTVADAPVSGASADTVRVVGTGVDVAPDRTAKSQRGKTIFLAHGVTNASIATDTYSLSSTSTLGSATAVMSDPNGDGKPDDASVITTTGAMVASSRTPVLARIRLPATAAHGNVDTVRVQASSPTSGASDIATDVVTVAGLLTYSDALFARPATQFFGQCATVYALLYRNGALGRFVWLDPNGVVRRTSADISAYSDGSVDDFYDCGSSPALGTWTIKFQDRAGGSYVDVGPAGTTTFEMRDLVAGGATISYLATDRDLYQLSGEALTMVDEVDNPTESDVLGSRIDDVAFQDADGDGAPTANEPYVRADGTIGSWSAGLTTSTRTGIDVYAGEKFADRVTTAPVSYSSTGPWTLQAKWTASCGFLLATRTLRYTVGCQPAPTFAGIGSGGDNDPCALDGILLTWSVASSWGLGTGGTYAVYRSTVPGFTPDATTLLVSGVTSLTFLDTTAAPDVSYDYVVRAESNVTCSSGPNNGGLMDSNFIHLTAADADAGIVPVASFTHSSPACLDAGSVVVTFQDASSGPPQAWAWDFDGDGTADATTAAPSWAFTTAGQHQVTLTVTNPCGQASVTRVVTVGERPVPAIVSDVTETCAGSAIDFDGSASVASAPQTVAAYSWDFDGNGIADDASANPAPFTYASAGSYLAALTVTDSLGCTATATVPVTIHDLLVVSTAVPTLDACSGSVSVVASASGGAGPFSFAWDALTDDGAGTGTGRLAYGASRAYTVTLTDAAGCTATATSASVTMPQRLAVSVAAPQIDSCTGGVSVGSTPSGGTAPYVVTWDALIDDGAGTGSGVLAPGSSRSYVVTVTDAFGCTASSTSATVSRPQVLAVTLGAPQVAQCTGDVRVPAVATGGTSPYVYTWDALTDDGAGAGTGRFALGSSRTVTVTATDAAGCVVQATSGVIVVNAQLALALDPAQVQPCTGATTLHAVPTGGDGAYTLTFSSLAGAGNDGSAILPPGPHVESVTLTDGSGCTTTATASFVVPELPTTTFTWDAAYVYPDVFAATLNAQGRLGALPYAFAWDLDADGTVDGAGPSFGFGMPANQTRVVELTLTDANGCTATYREAVSSAGCPVDTPLRLLKVSKSGAGFAFAWEASTHACHGRYDLLEATTARPSAGMVGVWPTDPQWSSLRTQDADGSDLDAAFLLAGPRPAPMLLYLVRDGGTDGSWGPVESYGNTGVTRSP